jgi:hypothetical protein
LFLKGFIVRLSTNARLPSAPAGTLIESPAVARQQCRETSHAKVIAMANVSAFPARIGDAVGGKAERHPGTSSFKLLANTESRHA